MTKKIIIGIVIAVLLALDWAALHDIIKGGEPNYWGEYAMLGFSIIVFITIALIGFKQTKSVN